MAVKDFTKKQARQRFSDVVLKMDNFFEDFKNISPFQADMKSLPLKAGVYVFYERNKPLYAGRTGNLRRRMAQHRNPGSKHNDAPFAYHLAKESARYAGVNVNNTRVGLCSDPLFGEHFSASKKRVAKMRVRFIEIVDSREQSLFEYYVSVELHTRWNDHSNS